MKLKLNYFVILITVIAISSCQSVVDNGENENQPYSTWLCIINSDGTGLHYLHEGIGSPQFTADGSKIVLGFTNGFKILDAEFGTVLVDIDTLSRHHNYAISNNNSICFSAHSDLTNSQDLFIYETITSSITNITMTDSVNEYDPSYNYNHDKIVYVGSELIMNNFITPNSISIMIYDFITQSSIPLLTNKFGIGYPQFSFDELQIIFSTPYSYNLFDINGQTSIETFDCSPEYYSASIYENKITFSSEGYLWKMNINGNELMDLGQGIHPQYSPDGTKIAYDGLYIMNSDGTNKQKLTDETGYLPHFSPDGSKIVFKMNKYEE